MKYNKTRHCMECGFDAQQTYMDGLLFFLWIFGSTRRCSIWDRQALGPYWSFSVGGVKVEQGTYVSLGDFHTAWQSYHDIGAAVAQGFHHAQRWSFCIFV